MRRPFLWLLAGAVLIVALTASSGFAANGPPPGKGPGGEEALGNNLSVPAIFVPSTTGARRCVWHAATP